MKKKVNTRDIFALNKKYITEINVHEKDANDFRGIMDNIPLFIERTLRHGNGISLNDVDYSVSENTFWDIEFFEQYCRNIFFSFKNGYTSKLIRRIKDIDKTDIQFFHQTLLDNFTPYQQAFDSNATSYLRFIGMKLQNLDKDGLLDEVKRLDKENRSQLLNALKEALDKKAGSQHSATENHSENEDNLPFTKMLRPVENSKLKTKALIQGYLQKAGISFELFSQKPVAQTAKESNPDGFKGAVAAMIYTFQGLNYFEKGFSFPEILDAYLKETGNKIGKLSDFKRHYLEDNYFIQYTDKLKDVLPKTLS